MKSGEHFKLIRFALVVQRTERKFPELEIGVQFLSGAQNEVSHFGVLYLVQRNRTGRGRETVVSRGGNTKTEGF